MFLQMARWWTTPEADQSFLQFRERSVRDGAWLTYVVALVVVGYALATWEAAPPLARGADRDRGVRRLPDVAAARRRPSSLALARAVLPRLDRARRRAGRARGRDRRRRLEPAARDVLPAADLRGAVLSAPVGGRHRRAVGARVPRRGAARRPRDGRDARGLLRDAHHRDGHGHLPGRQPRAPARRAADALALGPADRRAQPPRLHRALRRRALRPRAPRRPPARPDRDRPRRLQARQRHARACRRRRPAARGRRHARRRPAPLRRARPPRRRRVRGAAPRGRPGRAARRRRAARAAARRRRRGVDRHRRPAGRRPLR